MNIKLHNIILLCTLTCIYSSTHTRYNLEDPELRKVRENINIRAGKIENTIRTPLKDLISFENQYISCDQHNIGDRLSDLKNPCRLPIAAFGALHALATQARAKDAHTTIRDDRASVQTALQTNPNAQAEYEAKSQASLNFIRTVAELIAIHQMYNDKKTTHDEKQMLKVLAHDILASMRYEGNPDHNATLHYILGLKTPRNMIQASVRYRLEDIKPEDNNDLKKIIINIAGTELTTAPTNSAREKQNSIFALLGLGSETDTFDAYYRIPQTWINYILKHFKPGIYRSPDGSVDAIQNEIIAGECGAMAEIEIAMDPEELVTLLQALLSEELQNIQETASATKTETK